MIIKYKMNSRKGLITMKNISIKLGWILFITFILLGVPRIAGLFADQFNYANIDPDGAFAWISIHHIVQALLLLPVMFILTRTKNYNFGFSLGKKEVGLYFFRIYTLIISGHEISNSLKGDSSMNIKGKLKHIYFCCRSCNNI